MLASTNPGCLVFSVLLLFPVRVLPPAQAQTAPAPAPAPAEAPQLPTSVDVPAEYKFGPDDVLAVVFWREKDLSVDNVVVRPDGMITLPLINDVRAAGLTPDQLRERVIKAAARFVEDPNATVVVKQINSRKVFVTGEVNKPGIYPLTGQTTVLQIIATAGGLSPFADKSDIVVMRTEGGQTKSLKFNYKDVTKGKKLEQNVVLQPGDTIVVP